jgi:acyl-CoA thioesterase
VSTTDQDRSIRSAAAVEPLGPDHYAATLSPYYNVVGHPNGGYLQCVMANAALAGATAQGAHHLHASAVTTNFVSAPEPGAVQLRTDVRRVGRGVSFVHVTMTQDDHVTTESLVTLGILHEDSAPRYMDATPPELAPIDECRQSTGSDEINIMRVVDLRLDPTTVDWWSGEVSERGEVRAWLRLNDGDSDWSALSLHFACDAIPPATFPLGSSGWVPTLQFTTYVRRIPTSEWLRVRQRCVVIADGTVDERCELFDDRGELVASASQIAMVRFPSGQRCPGC